MRSMYNPETQQWVDVPDEQVDRKYREGFMFAKGEKLKVIFPHTQKVLPVDAAYYRDALDGGAQYLTGAIQGRLARDERMKGSEGKILAIKAGFAGGATLDPVADAFLAKTTDYTPEDIESARRHHPWTAGGAGVVGAGGTLLATGGLAAAAKLGFKGTLWASTKYGRMLGKAKYLLPPVATSRISEVAAKKLAGRYIPARLAGEATSKSYLAKLAGAAAGGEVVAGAYEGALTGVSRETIKYWNEEELAPPWEIASSVLSDVGVFAGVAGGFSGLLTGGRFAGAAAVQSASNVVKAPLGEFWAKKVDKATQLIAGVTNPEESLKLLHRVRHDPDFILRVNESEQTLRDTGDAYTEVIRESHTVQEQAANLHTGDVKAQAMYDVMRGVDPGSLDPGETTAQVLASQAEATVNVLGQVVEAHNALAGELQQPRVIIPPMDQARMAAEEILPEFLERAAASGVSFRYVPDPETGQPRIEFRIGTDDWIPTNVSLRGDDWEAAVNIRGVHSPEDQLRWAEDKAMEEMDGLPEQVEREFWAENEKELLAEETKILEDERDFLQGLNTYREDLQRKAEGDLAHDSAAARELKKGEDRLEAELLKWVKSKTSAKELKNQDLPKAFFDFPGLKLRIRDEPQAPPLEPTPPPQRGEPPARPEGDEPLTGHQMKQTLQRYAETHKKAALEELRPTFEKARKELNEDDRALAPTWDEFVENLDPEDYFETPSTTAADPDAPGGRRGAIAADYDDKLTIPIEPGSRLEELVRNWRSADELASEYEPWATPYDGEGAEEWTEWYNRQLEWQEAGPAAERVQARYEADYAHWQEKTAALREDPVREQEVLIENPYIGTLRLGRLEGTDLGTDRYIIPPHFFDQAAELRAKRKGQEGRKRQEPARLDRKWDEWELDEEGRGIWVHIKDPKTGIKQSSLLSMDDLPEWLGGAPKIAERRQKLAEARREAEGIAAELVSEAYVEGVESATARWVGVLRGNRTVDKTTLRRNLEKLPRGRAYELMQAVLSSDKAVARSVDDTGAPLMNQRNLADFGPWMFRQLDELKKLLDKSAKFTKELQDPGTINIREFSERRLGQITNAIRGMLESEQLWGGAGEKQRLVNRAFEQYSRVKKEARQSFGDYVSQRTAADPQKIQQVLREMSDDAWGRPVDQRSRPVGENGTLSHIATQRMDELNKSTLNLVRAIRLAYGREEFGSEAVAAIAKAERLTPRMIEDLNGARALKELEGRPIPVIAGAGILGSGLATGPLATPLTMASAQIFAPAQVIQVRAKVQMTLNRKAERLADGVRLAAETLRRGRFGRKRKTVGVISRRLAAEIQMLKHVAGEDRDEAPVRKEDRHLSSVAKGAQEVAQSVAAIAANPEKLAKITDEATKFMEGAPKTKEALVRQSQNVIRYLADNRPAGMNQTMDLVTGRPKFLTTEVAAHQYLDMVYALSDPIGYMADGFHTGSLLVPSMKGIRELFPDLVADWEVGFREATAGEAIPANMGAQVTAMLGTPATALYDGAVMSVMQGLHKPRGGRPGGGKNKPGRRGLTRIGKNTMAASHRVSVG